MLNEPSSSTLKKYGLSLEQWKEMADKQGHKCYVCQIVPTKNRLCIDHEHVKGWKKKPPEERVLYVRGLLCWRCNTTYLGRGISIDRAKKVVSYLEEYQLRRPNDAK